MSWDGRVHLGVISDIHGNVAALRRALAELDGQVEEILCAGDAFSDHAFSNEVIEALIGCRARYVLGNHELAFLGPSGRWARESPAIRAGNLHHVAAQTTELRDDFDGASLLMVHASPWDPHDQYLRPKSPLFDRADELGVDVLVVGHTHLPYVGRHGRTLVVNPGSLGRPERPDAPDVLSFAIIDTNALDAVLVEFDGGDLLSASSPPTIPVG